LSTAGQEPNERFIAEFLDDYFAESEEHLIILRRGLLALEQFVNQPQINRSLLDELFRSFHSLKGISGMVGVREAEQLAHQLESYLRILRHHQATLTAQGMDSLISSTKLLEQVIWCRREQQQAPDIAAAILQLERLLPDETQGVEATFQTPGASSLAVAVWQMDENGGIADPGQQQTPLWRFDFTPTPELAQRGININFVRSRLQEFGDLRNGAPRVLPGGAIAFEFLVASDADENTLAALCQDGVTFERLAEPAPALPQIAQQDSLDADGTKGVSRIASATVVRVNLNRLDELMQMVGELVISRARLEENLKAAEAYTPAARWRPLQETNQLIERQLRDLREGVMRVRLVPIGEIFERMRFVVRDLAREYQKKVALSLSGQETEIDKLLIERMLDPLMHLVRNAISHGLETPAERQASGKPPEGTIKLRAFAAAELVIIEVADDGRGINREGVVEKGRLLGLIGDQATVDDAELLDLICSPGFSTREEADRASGRGVGMAVVKNTVQGLGGEMTLHTEIGRGTTFTIKLPITLAIAEALIVVAGNQTFAVPQSSVREVIAIEPSSVKQLQNNEIIAYRSGVLPILRLARLFQLAENPDRAFHAFVIGKGLNAVAIAVDRIVGQREIVVRAINDPLIQVSGITGATELGDGRAVLILDAVALGKQSSAGQKIN
jgi:two-component system chemotaxis sensor kinase CheA